MRPIRFLLTLCLAAASVSHSFADRADSTGIDGIYQGTIGMQINAPSGKNLNYDAPAKFVFLPNGKGLILTAQHPSGVVSVVIKGDLNGATFIGESKGLMDYGGYHYGMRWDVHFDRTKGTALLHGKTLHLPAWAKDDDLTYTFHKQAAKK